MRKPHVDGYYTLVEFRHFACAGRVFRRGERFHHGLHRVKSRALCRWTASERQGPYRVGVCACVTDERVGALAVTISGRRLTPITVISRADYSPGREKPAVKKFLLFILALVSTTAFADVQHTRCIIAGDSIQTYVYAKGRPGDASKLTASLIPTMTNVSIANMSGGGQRMASGGAPGWGAC